MILKLTETDNFAFASTFFEKADNLETVVIIDNNKRNIFVWDPLSFMETFANFIFYVVLF